MLASQRERIVWVAALTALDDVSPRVSAKIREVLPRPMTLNTRTTFVSTSASEIWRTTLELYRHASLHVRPDVFEAWGSATAMSWFGPVVIVETGPGGSGPMGVESARASATI
jgi:hypothetical protein